MHMALAICNGVTSILSCPIPIVFMVQEFQDPSTRRQMLDTMHKVSPHVIIPFGPRARPAAVVTDTTKRRKADSLMPVKIDTAGRQAKAVLKKTGDSAALKPKDKPVVQKDSSTNQAP